MQESFSIGDFHPILVHFPIVLFSLGMLCDLLNGIGKKGALPVAHWMIIGGALMSIPTVITGLYAAEAFNPAPPALEKHHLFALVTTAVGGANALFRIFAMRKNWEIVPLVYVSFSLVTLLLVAATANYGGLVTHGTSLFNI